MSDQGFDDIEFEAMRYGFDGYGWMYVDNGSGGNWERRHSDAEPLYTVEALEEVEVRARKAMKAEIVAKLRECAGGYRVEADEMHANGHNEDDYRHLSEAWGLAHELADEIEAMP